MLSRAQVGKDRRVVGKMRRSPVTLCLVSFCGRAVVSNGLCSGHRAEQVKDGRHSLSVAHYELLTTHFQGPLGPSAFEKRLVGITKDLPLNRKTKGDFKRQMMKVYKEANESD